MLVSFTQTYGNDRGKLHEIYSRDKRLIEFKNLFDINIHSFHNCNRETIDNYKNLNKVKNSIYLEFNDITYGETIQQLKQKLKELNCTHFMFIQDDQFSGADYYQVDWVELIEYVKEQTNDFLLSLFYYPEMVGNQKEPDIKKETFSVYYSDSICFYNSHIMSMDDTSYICTMDLVDIIYDDVYCKEFNDIWNCEFYLAKKFSKIKLTRNYTNKQLIKTYNIIGKSLDHKDNYIYLLKKKKIY